MNRRERGANPLLTDSPERAPKPRESSASRLTVARQAALADRRCLAQELLRSSFRAPAARAKPGGSTAHPSFSRADEEARVVSSRTSATACPNPHPRLSAGGGLGPSRLRGHPLSPRPWPWTSEPARGASSSGWNEDFHPRGPPLPTRRGRELPGDHTGSAETEVGHDADSESVLTPAKDVNTVVITEHPRGILGAGCSTLWRLPDTPFLPSSGAP